MKFPSWYGIGVGTLIILQWNFFFATDSIPQLDTAPWEIGFHLLAEFLLALALMIGGVATLKSIRWGRGLSLVALGMAAYSEINSPGYFAQHGQWPFVIMFAALLLGAALSILLLLKQGEQK